MTVWVMEKAVYLLEQMNEEDRNALMVKINLTGEEIARWKDIIHKMTIPFMKNNGRCQIAHIAPNTILDPTAFICSCNSSSTYPRQPNSSGRGPNIKINMTKVIKLNGCSNKPFKERQNWVSKQDDQIPFSPYSFRVKDALPIFFLIGLTLIQICQCYAGDWWPQTTQIQ